LYEWRVRKDTGGTRLSSILKHSFTPRTLTESRCRQEDIRYPSSSVLSNNEGVFPSIPRHLVKISTKY
jgi:hypothetical protein